MEHNFPKNDAPVKQISTVLNQFFKNTKVAQQPFDTITGLLILSAFYNPNPPRLVKLSPREFLIVHEAARLMKFASSAFGWKLIYPFMHRGEEKKKLRYFAKAFTMNKANELALSIHCGIDVEKDLIEVIPIKKSEKNF